MRISFYLPRTVMLLASFGLAGPSSVRLTAATPVYQWSTVVGRASAGSEDGVGDKARFNAPQGLALDATGNLYVADKSNHTIRKITPAGVVSTVAGMAGLSGSLDGVGSAARFNAPEGVAVDASGNLYVADTGNHTVRKITASGTVTTFAGLAGTAGAADGPVASASFNNPFEVGVDGAGNLYVLDRSGIRRIAGGQVQTIYQPGGTITVPNYDNTSVTATIGMSGGFAVDEAGGAYFTVGLQVYYSVIDRTVSFPAVLKRDAQGVVSLAHGGPKTYASGSVLYFRRLAIDREGNMAITATSQWEGAQYLIFRAAAAGGPTSSDSLHQANGADIEAHGVALSSTGDLYYSRDDNAIFRRAASGDTTLVAGVSEDALPFRNAWSITVDAANTTWVAMEENKIFSGRGSDGVSLKKVAPDGTLTTVIAPQFYYEMYGNSTPLVAADGPRGVGFLHGMYTQSTLTRVAPDGAITDAFIGLKPNGTSYVSFYAYGFAFDPSGSPVVPDSYGHAIWRRSADGTWAILAGKDGEAGSTDGTGTDARFNNVQAIITDRSGNFYVLDSAANTSGNPRNSVIRRITPAGVVTTVSGDLVQNSPAPGSTPVQPIGLAVDSKGVFYLAYPGLNSVWRLEGNGPLTMIGGLAGVRGDNDDLGTAAHFMAPAGIAVDAQDRLLVLDAEAGALRRGVPLFGPGITGQPQSATVAVGSSVQFAVTASGTPEPLYQWNFNGASIAGATGSSYTIGSVQAANAGNYTVTVSNKIGSTTSSTATLTMISGGGGNGNGGLSASGGGGGGGAPGIWFYVALGAVALGRFGARLGARRAD